MFLSVLKCKSYNEYLNSNLTKYFQSLIYFDDYLKINQILQAWNQIQILMFKFNFCAMCCVKRVASKSLLRKTLVRMERFLFDIVTGIIWKKKFVGIKMCTTTITSMNSIRFGRIFLKQKSIMFYVTVIYSIMNF